MAWRIGNALISYVAYLGQFFWPLGLVACYPRRAVLPPWQVAAAALTLVCITAVAVWWWRRRPYLLVGWLWYLGMLAPVIGLVQFGAQSEADRFAYLPQIGLAIALVWAGGRGLPVLAAGPLAVRRCREPGAGGVDGVRLASDGLLARQRDPLDPRSGLRLAESRGPQQPRRPLWPAAGGSTRRCAFPEGPGDRARLRRGPQQPRHRSGRLRADRRGDRALPEGPGDQARLRRGPQQPRHRSGGPRTDRRGDRALPEGPGDQARLRRGPQQPGRSLLPPGRIDEAIAHYQKALEIRPDYAEAHNNLGIALAGRGRIDEAIAHFQKALEIKPDYAEAHNNLGIALAGRGRIDEAIAHFQKALEIKPDYADGPYQPRRCSSQPGPDGRGDRALAEGPGLGRATEQSGHGRRLEGPAAAL